MQSQLTFCETNIHSDLELGNTFTSFAYIVVGLLIISRHWKNKDWDFIEVGLASVFVGIGSIALHATKTQVGLIVDFYSMSVLTGIILSEFFLKNRKMLRLGVHIVGIVFFLVSISTLSYILVQFLFAAYAALALSIGIIRYESFRKSRYLLYGIVLMVVAFIFWVMDTTRYTCNFQQSILNGHSIWHILTTLVIYFVYLSLVQIKKSKES